MGIKTKYDYEAVATVAQDRIQWKSVAEKVTGVFLWAEEKKITAVTKNRSVSSDFVELFLFTFSVFALILNFEFPLFYRFIAFSSRDSQYYCVKENAGHGLKQR